MWLICENFQSDRRSEISHPKCELLYKIFTSELFLYKWVLIFIHGIGDRLLGQTAVVIERASGV